MSEPRLVIDAFAGEFARYRRLAEGATTQLPFEALRVRLDPETNSIAVIMKHVGGNLHSRWTEPFTTDGEKPGRDRDSEFVDDFADRAALEEAWTAGWGVLESTLAGCTDGDLARNVMIRGQPHTLASALARSVAHVAYHTGQITQLSRHHAQRLGLSWNTLTVPRAGTKAFNRALGYDPASGGTPGG
jgi:uncharacterized damage-inducible protein DinB